MEGGKISLFLQRKLTVRLNLKNICNIRNVWILPFLYGST